MYAGAEWIKSSLKKEMSPLGEATANLLGRVFQGIYHLNSGALKRVDWFDNYCIQFIYHGHLSTVDFHCLTALVVFAHDEMIRVDIEGCGPGRMRLIFHQRKSRTGSMSERCPTIEDNIKRLRSMEKTDALK